MMLGLETVSKPKQMGKRQKLRRSASEVETFRKSESSEGRFGNFEIISYTPLIRKNSSVVGFTLNGNNSSGDALRSSESSLVLNANSSRLLSSKSSGRYQTLSISPTALELLKNPKLKNSPYSAKLTSHRDKPVKEKIGKIFLSEKHTRNISEDGSSYPGAPPATPTPILLQKTEYIPSMTDIRAQRSLNDRLQSMKNVQKAKSEKMRRDSQRQEKLAEVERLKDEKRQQRRVIYALNELMTRAENNRFDEFIKKNGFGA